MITQLGGGGAWSVNIAKSMVAVTHHDRTEFELSLSIAKSN